MDEILWCDHSNETSSAVLSHGTICLVCSSNFWVCGWNRMVLPFKWDLAVVLSLGAIHSVYSSQFYESVYYFSGYRAASPFGSDFKILKTNWFWKQFASPHRFRISTQEPRTTRQEKNTVLETETSWNWPRNNTFQVLSFQINSRNGLCVVTKLASLHLDIKKAFKTLFRLNTKQRNAHYKYPLR